jgi:hypothetical protein
MPQTSVAATLTVGQIGQLAYEGDANLLARGYTLENATAIPPGRGVNYDAVNDSVLLPSAGGQLFQGVCFDDGKLPIDQTSYETGETVPVVKKGEVWVLTSEAVDPSDAVFLQHTAGAGKPAGSFRTDADGGNADAVSGCQWTGVFSSGKASLYVNLPA